MKIHSSSLTISPIRINPQQIAETNARNNNASNELTKAPQTLSTAQSPGAIKKTLENNPLNHDLINRESAYKPTDKRTLTALNAYSQEINQPLRDQRAELIARVDIYA